MDDFEKLVRIGGAPFALLVVFVVGLLREWWVMGSQYREMRVERNEWKTLFLRTMRVTETAVTVAKRSGGSSKGFLGGG